MVVIRTNGFKVGIPKLHGALMAHPGRGGALTLVLGTHCKTDSRSCGFRLEKGGLSLTKELSEGGLSEGHFLLGFC